MAQKRMFTMNIVDSDAFLDMPLSTQCLYFHLNMRADDDGFIGNPKRIQKLIGASEDDLKLLIAKRFILVFEDGVIVIKHWRMHNTIQRDRYTPTVYQDEMSELLVKDNKAYSLTSGMPCKQLQKAMETKCFQNVSTDIDIGLDIDKDINNISIADKSAKGPKAEIITQYFDDVELNNAFNNWIKYKKEKRQAYKETGLQALVSRVQKNAEQYGVSKVVDVIEKSMSANYQGIVWDWITKSESRGCLSTEERVERMKNEFTNNFKFKNSVPERFIG
jgi:hypothetical protein